MVEEKLKLRLAGGRGAPARARRALAGLNGSLAGLAEPVRLLVSELVTNSVLHARAGPEVPIELELTASPERVRVEVCDPGPGFQPRTAGPEPNGFGLMLVECLADRWGVDPGGRSRVWFEIDRRSAAA